MPEISQELAGNQILWRTRDMLLDGVSDKRAEEMLLVSGREHLDAALARKKGCMVLTSHFGAHMLPAHWMYRKDYPVRLYMERPRNISRYMTRRFGSDGALSQDKLFISPRGNRPMPPARYSERRGAQERNGALPGGRCALVGPDDRGGEIPGADVTVFDDLDSPRVDGGSTVVIVYCRIGPDRRYHIEFHPPFEVPRDVEQDGQTGYWVQHFIDILQEQIRLHPANSNDYLFWCEKEDRAA